MCVPPVQLRETQLGTLQVSVEAGRHTPSGVVSPWPVGTCAAPSGPGMSRVVCPWGPGLCLDGDTESPRGWNPVRAELTLARVLPLQCLLVQSSCSRSLPLTQAGPLLTPLLFPHPQPPVLFLNSFLRRRPAPGPLSDELVLRAAPSSAPDAGPIPMHTLSLSL